jgi:antitoxin (DNA-binding transcriptional repressor) of toxin-antitoxin stability system
MVGATEFKAKCLALIDEMERSGEPLTITHRGKASITLTAQRPAPMPIASAFGLLNGTVTIHGDIDGPIDLDWEENGSRTGTSSSVTTSRDRPRHQRRLPIDDGRGATGRDDPAGAG